MALTSFPFPRWFRPDAEKCTNSSAMAGEGNSSHDCIVQWMIVSLTSLHFCVCLDVGTRSWCGLW